VVFHEYCYQHSKIAFATLACTRLFALIARATDNESLKPENEVVILIGENDEFDEKHA